MSEEQTKAGAGGQDIGWLKGLPSDLVCHPRSVVELGLERGVSGIITSPQLPADLCDMSCWPRLWVQVLLLYKPPPKLGCSSVRTRVE